MDKASIEGATQSQCVADAEAAMLGTYVVRAHQFTNLIGDKSRAETVSLVRIVRKQGGELQMQDTSCVASTTTPSGSVRALGTSFFKIPTQVAPINLPTATTFVRGAPANLQPTGFSPAMPDFCPAPSGAPTAKADFDAYPLDLDSTSTPSSGSIKQWLAGTKACTCPPLARTCSPNAVNEACLPAANVMVPTNATDCRLNDPDEDGLPGFTVLTSLLGGQQTTAASAGNAEWTNGTVQQQGFHSALAPPASPFFRHFTSCTGAGCGLLAGGAADKSCGTQYNYVQFRKLASDVFGSLSCATFYNTDTSTLSTLAADKAWTAASTAVKQTAIDDFFNGKNGALPACGAGNSCPTGMLCRSATCYPITSPGACSVPADCPTGMTCSGTACWPASCPG